MFAFITRWLSQPLQITVPNPQAGTQCPACKLVFTRADVRNLHYMRKHADRRSYRS